MKHYAIESRKPTDKTDHFREKMEPIFEKYRSDYTVWYTKTCEWCHKEFQVSGRRKNNKFCSSECLDAYRKRNRNSQYCEICGKDMGWTRYKRKYCPDCLSIHKSVTASNRVTTKCAYCGKEIQVIPSRYKSQKNVYCDAKCMAKHYAQIYTGENSPTWTGGKRHYTGGWIKARTEARARDKYTCAICGITEAEYGQELSVHHIRKYKDFANKVEANKLENLISLCEPCHRFVHSNNNVDKVFIMQ